jgi:ATP-dependent phosphoenolpyruvate carboxykinase
MWHDKDGYDRAAAELAERFAKNFEKFDAPAAVRDAGPRPATVAK